jgi:3-hydroxyacyl-CoA dehydrogenase
LPSRTSRSRTISPVSRGAVLVIGFGRFGQIVSQCLLAEGIDVTTIDNDPDMIQQAAASASRSTTAMARGSTSCVPGPVGAAGRHLRQRPRAASRIVDLVHADFPGTKL